METLHAFWLGIKDGYDQPYDLTSGLTWGNNRSLNEIYDHGVNMGQRIGALRRAINEARKTFRTYRTPQSGHLDSTTHYE
jgi:hypothetical protein